MSDSLRWKYSLNAGLLYGTKLPPASLNVPDNRRGVPRPTQVHCCVPFHGASFMNKQGGEKARAAYISYLRSILPLIDLPPPQSSNEGNGVDTMRFVGVITQLHDPHAMSTSERLAPWEFYAITDLEDDDQFTPILQALSATRPQLAGAQFEEEPPATSGHAVSRLSLYSGQVSRFTCLYQGAVVGIIGTPSRRDLNGRLTTVLVQDIIQPRRLIPRWYGQTSRPLSTTNGTQQQQHTPDLRVMYVSGPYPRRAVSDILASVVDHAIQRQATLLIIGGPLITNIDESDRVVLNFRDKTFADTLDSIIGNVETHLAAGAASNVRGRALRVVFVPSIDDMTELPVLPQVHYSFVLGDDTSTSPVVQLASNPCRIEHGGISIGVVQHDVISDMRERMVERMQGREEGSLLRVVEAVVNSRLYAPFFEFPNRFVDSQHIDAIRIDKDHSSSPTSSTAHDEQRATTSGLKQTPASIVDDVPHVIFMPSCKPQFAFTSHAGKEDLSDVSSGSGPLVVNPMIWNHLNKRQPHFMNVVEVTIPDPEFVAAVGVGHANSEVTVSVFSAYRE